MAYHPSVKWVVFFCENCGKKKKQRITEHHRFCSSSCRISGANKSRRWRDSSRLKISIANKGRLSGKKNPNWGGGKLKFFCDKCHKLFYRSKWESKKQETHYCSRKCYFLMLATNKMSEGQKRLHVSIRRAVLRCLSDKKGSRKWENILGFSAVQLIHHLESMFSIGMTWDNYGKWHVDHIKPVSAFQFYSDKDKGFKLCWALQNLQPLWALDNIKKGGVKRYGNINRN